MKKLLFLFMSTVFLCSSSVAMEIVAFRCEKINDRPLTNGHPKSPIQPPTVYLDDYVLTFEADHPDYTLYIKDEDGDVVYTTTVFSTQTDVILPSILSGNYEINLVMGNWLFTGWIYL